MIDEKVLLFLINFFDGLGLGLIYPWLIFSRNPIKNTEIESAWRDYNKEDGGIQIYMHTLFCETKCLYCNCISYVEKENEVFEKYKNSLILDLKRYSGVIDKEIDTLYFGGGTFSLWKKEQMEDIVLTIKQYFRLSKNYKWMVEIHPNSITREKLELIKNIGVTDLMVGIQTTSARLNKLNNRIYKKEKIYELVNNIIDLGFEKVYFDLMYALPYENTTELIDDMNFVVSLGKYLEKKNFKANLELHRFNVSANIGYFNKIKSMYSNFSDFLKSFYKNNEDMDVIVSKYKEQYLEKLFSSRRDEIVARKKNNTAILGVGTGSISYIPEKLFYYNNITTPNKWKDSLENKGFRLNSIDTVYAKLFNDLRYGIDATSFKSLLSQVPEYKTLFSGYEKFLKVDKDKIIFSSDSDLELHLITLRIYDQTEKTIVYNDLLDKWKSLGYSFSDLQNNVDYYLKLYY